MEMVWLPFTWGKYFGQRPEVDAGSRISVHFNLGSPELMRKFLIVNYSAFQKRFGSEPQDYINRQAPPPCEIVGERKKVTRRV